MTAEKCPECGHAPVQVTITEGQAGLSKTIAATHPSGRNDFTLADIEAVLVEFRAAGAWDEARVGLGYGRIDCEVILRPIELPRALLEPTRARARLTIPYWLATLALFVAMIVLPGVAALWPWVTR